MRRIKIEILSLMSERQTVVEKISSTRCWGEMRKCVTNETLYPLF